MNFRNKAVNKNGLTINITPLIDVVFILLIFFAVTTSFITTTAIKVDLPKALGDQMAEKKEVVVEIAYNNGGIAVTVNGSLIPGKKELETVFKDLEQKFIQEGAEPKTVMVVINADARVEHGEVVNIIDTARTYNFAKFGIGVTSTAGKR